MAEIEKLAASKAIPMAQFERAAATGREGVVMIGVAQEKANVFRPPSRHQRVSGKFGATQASAFVKHFYLYIWDRDFAPVSSSSAPMRSSRSESGSTATSG